MKVTLTSVGNPDFRQDPNKPLYGCDPDSIVDVDSFEDASRVCMGFISNGNLGAGNWSGGAIHDDEGNQLAQVSYNGRVWEGVGYATGRKEIELDFS
jgi:hypothetical protein